MARQPRTAGATLAGFVSLETDYLRLLRQGVYLAAFLAMAPGSHAGTVFTVTTTADSGPKSLRQAILDANASPGLDTITFKLPGAGVHTINLLAALPQIVDPVLIDGTTQPGYAGSPLIELNGANAGPAANGLTLLASATTVRGLAINRFQTDGIHIEGAGENIIQANFIGTDPTGLLARGNHQGGIFIFGSSANWVGGTNAHDGNLISGGNQSGIFIVGPNANSNVVFGNLIGTDVTGAAKLGNAQNGVVLSSGVGNRLGGTIPGSANVISGNGQSGIYLVGNNTRSNWLQGNYIGTDPQGSNALGNVSDGITLYGVDSNIVGGDQPAARNLISGNGARGIFITSSGANSNWILGNFIGTDLSASRALSNGFAGVAIAAGQANRIGASASAGNLISGNGESGIAFTDGAAGNWVQGNRIGTDSSGVKSLGNGFNGVSISSWSNVVGGSVAGAGNVISGNRQNGVFISGTNGYQNQLQGNFIGTDVNGHTGLGNGLSGVLIDAASGNLVGGGLPGCGNVIAGNLNGAGIFLNGTNASANTVQHNFIGTDITGRSALRNNQGINIDNAPSNNIGGVSVWEGNLICGSSDVGIYILGALAAGNVVQGNSIGVDVTGSNALANLNNGGIYLYGSPKNLIGGAAPGTGNLISGNAKGIVIDGVSASVAGAVSNVILGNLIGTASDGVSPLGNLGHNIEFLNSAKFNVVGGLLPGAANRIAFAQTTGYDGVRIRDGCLGNVIRANSIFANAGLAIDWSDDGPSPAGTPALSFSTGRYRTRLQGSLNGLPAKHSFILDFYANSAKDPTGYGEGERWIYSTVVTSDAAGRSSFSRTFSNTVEVVGFISATVTDESGTTSEFGLSRSNSVSPVLDTDGDGLPDEYELAWGFNPLDSSDAAADADADGLTNLQEFLAGTNPRDAVSQLALSIMGPNSNQALPGGASHVLLSFPSVLGKSYTVQTIEAITSGWQTLATALPGTGGFLLLDDGPVGPSRFYRLSFE